MNTLAELHRARLALQRRDLVSAAAACRNVLARDPRDAAANHLLGVIELQSGRPASAAALIEKSIEVDAGDAQAHLNLGAAYMALDRADAALCSFDRALAIDARWAQAWSNRGNALQALRQPEAALRSHRTAIECDPRDPRAHCNLANALRDVGRREEALLAYRQSFALEPDYALALRNCGGLLHELGRPAEALLLYRRVLRIAPRDMVARVACGNMLLALSRFGEAVSEFDEALALDPGHLEALNNRGAACLQLGDSAAALESFDRLHEIAPRVPGFLANRGEALRRMNRLADAAAAYAALVELAPGFELALGKLFGARQAICDWSDSERLVAEIERGVARGHRICAPFDILAVTDSPTAQFQCSRLYAARQTTGPVRPSTRRSAKNGETIRLAYVSADFGNRPLTHLMVGVLEHHDRGQFETIGISLRPPEATEIGGRVVRSVDRFIDVSRESDHAVGELMAQLDVRIAVDLMGHTHGSRPAIFSNRAAPIQVAYLGFPGTTGMECMDYLLADDFLIPEASRQCYAEQVVYLPDCFQANDDRRCVGPAPTRQQAGLPDNAFVFSSFNNSYKLTPRMFDVWCRLLVARPSSVLWLLADGQEVQRNLRREAVRRGVDAERLIFALRVPYPEHVARQSLADLFLDTLPFNAGTTASGALWAGLPVLTCAGGAFAARMAGSLLRAAGCPELITHSLEEYEQRALLLSGPGSELAGLRRRLAPASRSGPLFDTRRFTRNLESAYREMWKRHRTGVAPTPIRIVDV